MLKFFLKDTIIYAIGVFAIRLINFILMPFLTRKLSPADYGIITLILTMGSLVSYIITLQITQAIPKYCANNEDPIDKRSYISSGFWYVIFVYGLFFTIASLFPRLSEVFLGIPNQRNLFNLALLNICLFGLFTYLETQLRWDKKAVAYTIVSVMIMILSLVLIAGLVFLDMGLSGYFIGSAIAQLVGCVMAYYYGRDNYGLTISIARLKKMLIFSYPLSVSAVGSYLYSNINQWLIRFFCSLSALGIYGVASRFSSILPIILGCISLSITPIIYADHHKKEMPQFLSFLFRVSLLLALYCAAIFSVFYHQILLLVVSENFLAAGKFIPFILLSYTFSSLYVFTPGQWIFNKTKEMAAVNLIAGGINIILAFILIKLFSITGAVSALFIASLFQLGLNIYFSQKYYPIDFKIMRTSMALGLFLSFSLIKTNGYLLLPYLLVSSLLLITKKDITTYLFNISSPDKETEQPPVTHIV